MRASRKIGRGKGKLVGIDLCSPWNYIKGARGSAPCTDHGEVRGRTHSMESMWIVVQPDGSSASGHVSSRQGYQEEWIQ